MRWSSDICGSLSLSYSASSLFLVMPFPSAPFPDFSQYFLSKFLHVSLLSPSCGLPFLKLSSAPFSPFLCNTLRRLLHPFLCCFFCFIFCAHFVVCFDYVLSSLFYYLSTSTLPSPLVPSLYLPLPPSLFLFLLGPSHSPTCKKREKSKC